MARMNDSGQWIILMGFIVAIALFFLAYVINESTLVGETTAESVLDFPKSDIADVRAEIIQWSNLGDADRTEVYNDTRMLTLHRKHAITDFYLQHPLDPTTLLIHYNNGVTKYDESITLRSEN